MATPMIRQYKCKDAELPVTCGIAADSLKRDLSDFMAYSKKFTSAYLEDFKTNIEKVFEVVIPQSEIQRQKVITERINKTLDSLINPINRLTGYIKFSHTDHTDYGNAMLRKAITDSDAEGAIKSLSTISANIANFKEALVEQGLTEEAIELFASANKSLKNDKLKQAEIFSNRKKIVQDNLGLLNDLFGQLTEILTAGKILYNATDRAKAQDYSFEDLKKRVRRASKPENKKMKDNGEAPAGTNEK